MAAAPKKPNPFAKPAGKPGAKPAAPGKKPFPPAKKPMPGKKGKNC